MSSAFSEPDDLRRQLDRWKALVEVGRAFSQELHPEALLRLVVDRATEILGADSGALLLLDPDRQELWTRTAEDPLIGEVRFPMGRGPEGHVATTGETLNIPELSAHPLFPGEANRRAGYPVRSLLCTPVRGADGTILGVMEALNKLEGAFTREDEELLSVLASQAAVALRNAQLFQELRLLKSYNESILHSMATAVVTLDPAGNVTTLNPAALRLFGLQDLDWRHMPLRRLLNGDRNRSLVEAIGEALAAGREYTGYDLKLTDLAGNPVSLNLRALPLSNAEGETLGSVLVADDISREQRLIHAFSRYMERSVIQRLLQGGDERFLGGTRQDVTILFSDIRGYTSLAERSTAEEVVAMLNDYFSRMTRQVFRYEGTLDKYIGDAIMAVFGAPATHDDDELRAVLAAISMRRELWRYNQERIAAGSAPIEIGIGIASGEAISGNVGSAEYVDYTVIGDVVNVASRLEGLTKDYPCKILLNDDVYENVREAVPCVELGLDYIKGRTEPVRLFGIPEDWIRQVSQDSLDALLAGPSHTP